MVFATDNEPIIVLLCTHANIILPRIAFYHVKTSKYFMSESKVKALPFFPFQEDKLEEATTSFTGISDPNCNPTWGQATPLMTSIDSADHRRNSTMPSTQDASAIPPAENAGGGGGSGQGSPKTNPDRGGDESGMESDTLTYRGIYLPTLTNRFSDKKLETAYERYACRQVKIHK